MTNPPTSHLFERAAAERKGHDERIGGLDFNLAPLPIAWEVTRACSFACVHCRADTQHQRDPSKIQGKCGICEYEDVCGGQRGRANGVSGDHRASDPTCVYIPNSIRLIQ